MAVSLWQRGRKDQLAMAALLFALLTVATGRDDVWAQVLRLEESSSRLLVLLATRAIAGRQMLLLVPLALTLPRIIAGTGASVSRYLSRTVAEWVGDEGIPCPATALRARRAAGRTGYVLQRPILERDASKCGARPVALHE